MAKVLLDYTILDNLYQNGKFRFFQGDDGGPTDVQSPLDTKLTGGIQPTDSDPVLSSYMGGSKLDTPRALVCIVTTDFTTGKSTGKYSVCTPTTPGTPVSWVASGGPQGIELVDQDDNPVAGNPYGVAQVGGYLFIVEYDTATVYTINIAKFEAATGATYTVDGATDISKLFPNPVAGAVPHGAAIIALTSGSGSTAVSYIYALYASANETTPPKPVTYNPSALVRLTVDPTTGALSGGTGVSVGLNATALVPAPGGTDGTTILVPALGGTQQSGATNGTASNLYRVPAFANFAKASIAFTGDTTTTVTAAGNYDIRGVAVSDDGIVYLLTGTYDTNYNTYWKLFQTTVANVLAANGVTISAAVAANPALLIQVDSGVATPGYYWEVLYENASPVANGRLWFVEGTPIRISQGSTYSKAVSFTAATLYGDTTVTDANINSADLIGEMIYQFKKGASIDTRLIKGKRSQQVAKAIKAAAVEEEEKK